MSRLLPAVRDALTPTRTYLVAAPATGQGAGNAAGGGGHGGREAALAATLARLEVCARHRDHQAAARALDRLPATEDGAWLLIQMAAAGLRALSTGAQQLPPTDVATPPGVAIATRRSPPPDPASPLAAAAAGAAHDETSVQLRRAARSFKRSGSPRRVGRF